MGENYAIQIGRTHSMRMELQQNLLSLFKRVLLDCPWWGMTGLHATAPAQMTAQATPTQEVMP